MATGGTSPENDIRAIGTVGERFTGAGKTSFNGDTAPPVSENVYKIWVFRAVCA